MTPLIPVDIEMSALTSFGFDQASSTLAVTFRDDPDVWHFAGLPQEIVDGLAQSVAYYSDETADMFTDEKPLTPDHFLDQYVRGTPGNPIYSFTKVVGAAAADVAQLGDPTLPPAPAPSPSPAPAPAPAQG